MPLFFSRTILSDAVSQRVQSMVARHSEVVERLNDPDSTNAKDFASLGKELSSLASVVSLYERLSDLEAEWEGVQELLQEAIDFGDQEMKAECQADQERLASSRQELEKKVHEAVLPKDENDTESDAILEIRAGTGGEEAALFTGELLQTYLQTAKAMKWKVDLLSQTKTDLGGVREAAINVTGRASNSYSSDDPEADEVGPYGYFRFESGVHRVQRVPINSTKIQTSACSVGVLPAPNEENKDALLQMKDLAIETMRASGAGGQHVNTTDSAVRITHIPTGIQASIQDERSQHQNKAKALKLIAARVRQHLQEEEDKARGAERSSLMGGGDRSERIRTYNFPQDRVTDHRCKHSSHGLEKLLGGGVDAGLVTTFFPLMRQQYKEELMKELESSNS